MWIYVLPCTDLSWKVGELCWGIFAGKYLRHALTVSTSVNLWRSKMTHGTPTQYPVKASGDLKKVTAIHYRLSYEKIKYRMLSHSGHIRPAWKGKNSNRLSKFTARLHAFCIKDLRAELFKWNRCLHWMRSLKKEKLWELPSVCGLNYPALFITGISLATNFLINLYKE